MKEVVVLTKLAEDAIKKNELKLAKIALVKAIKLNPTSAPSYMLLVKYIMCTRALHRLSIIKKQS